MPGPALHFLSPRNFSEEQDRMSQQHQERFRSPYAQQLEKGFPWLRFNPTLEVGFRETCFRQHLVRLRIHILLGVVLFMGLAAIDRFFLPPLAMHWSLIMRLGVMPLLGAVTLCLSFCVRRRAMVGLVMTCLLAAAVGVLMINGFSARDGFVAAIGGMTLLSVYVYFMAELLFFEALLCGLLMLGAFLVTGLIAPIPREMVFYHAIFLAFANIFGAVGLYTLELSRRRDYLQQRLLNDQADRDPLTGLYNRRYLTAHCRDLWRLASVETRPIAVLMVDVDRFKAYNDAYGHMAGDTALARVATALSTQARQKRDVVARFGGEEFAIICYDVNLERAERQAAALTRAVEDLGLPHPDGNDGRLTISIGLAVDIPPPGHAPELLINRADQALYLAKEAGRNRYVRASGGVGEPALDNRLAPVTDMEGEELLGG